MPNWPPIFARLFRCCPMFNLHVDCKLMGCVSHPVVCRSRGLFGRHRALRPRAGACGARTGRAAAGRHVWGHEGMFRVAGGTRPGRAAAGDMGGESRDVSSGMGTLGDWHGVAGHGVAGMAACCAWHGHGHGRGMAGQGCGGMATPASTRHAACGPGELLHVKPSSLFCRSSSCAGQLCTAMCLTLCCRCLTDQTAYRACKKN